jgi:hypothetical protein
MPLSSSQWLALIVDLLFYSSGRLLTELSPDLPKANRRQGQSGKEAL